MEMINIVVQNGVNASSSFVDITNVVIYEDLEYVLCADLVLNFNPLLHRILSSSGHDIKENFGLAHLKNGIVIVSKETSFVETCLDSKIRVGCQYDVQYNNIAENQCTWFSLLCAKKREELLEKYLNSNVDFVNLYESILLIASSMRKDKGFLPQGENLDEIDREFFSDLFDTASLKSCTFGDLSFVFSLPAEIQKMILKTHDDIQKCNFTDFIHDVLNLTTGKYLSVNADGKTFMVICIDEKLLLLDSHTKWSGEITKQNFMKYVTGDNSGNYFILWLTN